MGNFVINNNSTNIPHSKEPQIDLKIEVYNITYDWGIASLGSPNFREFVEPHYIGTLDEQFTSATFSVDSTSDMRYTGSFSIILDYDSPFIVHANDYLFWQNVWLKVIKIYDYPNGNEETDNTRDEHIIGWFVSNIGSYNYNASSREFSMSCTDMMSFLTESRGGHLTNWEESEGGLNYIFYEMFKASGGFASQPNNHPNTRLDNFVKDNIYRAARCSSGLVLEGKKNISTQEKQYDNFLTQQNFNNVTGDKDITDTNALWNETYKQYQKEHEDETKEEPWRTKFYYLDENGEWNDSYYDDTNSMLVSLVSGYAHIIPIASVAVNLQNGRSLLPYDLEFNGDTTLYDVLKKVTELYPRQSIYFDSDRRLNIRQYALTWGSNRNKFIAAKRQDFMGLILNEQWNINLENIKNFTVVWGRNQTCVGYYGMTSMKGVCPECGKFHEFYISPTGAEGHLNTCVICGTPLQRLNMNDETYSTQRIGTHKQVIYNDNLLTDEECFNAAKALTIESCRAKKTLSVTLFDRYLPLYNLSNGEMWGSDTGVGRIIEYTSALTGETDLYTLLKWSNDFNSGTVILELEPFYPCTQTLNVLPIPKFKYEISDTGLLTMEISGKGDLFKIYCSQSSLLPITQENIWNWTTLDLNFIGETDTEIFTYQFTESGVYSISCQAWSSTIFPSPLADYQVFTVEIKEEIRVDINTGETTTEINGNSISIGVNYLVTKDNEYITDNNGNKFIY